MDVDGKLLVWTKSLDEKLSVWTKLTIPIHTVLLVVAVSTYVAVAFLGQVKAHELY